MTTLGAAMVPRVTVAPAAKLVPVIVTAVPPPLGPLVGDTLPTVGAGPRYVKPLLSVPLCPPGLVTVTATAPAACAAVVAVIVVALTMTMPVAAVPPIVTVAPAANPLPAIVTAGPPAPGPPPGVTPFMSGGGGG